MFKWIDIDKQKPQDGERCIILTGMGELIDSVFFLESTVLKNKNKDVYYHGEGFYRMDDYFGFWCPVCKPLFWIPYPKKQD
jgi:hypothetical protein